MNQRVIAAISAGVLALLGVVVLVIWAQGANDRAFDGAELVPVLRLTADVPAGVSSAELTDSTEVVKLPREAIAEGAVSTLDDVAGRLTNAPVQRGEVLLASRMVAPKEVGEGSTEVPKGFQEMSFSLETQRVIAGAVEPGDRIGVIGSFDDAGNGSKTSSMVLSNVLVTKVNSGVSEADLTAVSVTVALSSADMERLAFTIEFGRTWLTLQNSETDQKDVKPMTIEGVL